ncbi:pyridoxal phosphate-dependent aminotransferase family protein [uncultured Maribacter sp.]|uniref:aminotransferase class I/II-fold pyridoxal phosphate-dependent enzyme n=1 Tax=uncultured Maribacter sp. TaxID=431308 RepID=UPI00263889AB|nr:pyridoxal phosphate-dependent aminotransferase family protein [uncultured Maribacter sp.]
MCNFPSNLGTKLKKRELEDALRSLPSNGNLVDFSSNDYLGFATNDTLYANTFQLLLNKGISQNGATGSRLISGNHNLYKDLEYDLSTFFKVESALVFNSGYDANLGFFSAVPQREDIILFDEFIHASIRDGILLSNAKKYKYKHNDLIDLEEKLSQALSKEFTGEVYVVTESIFSMDGDSPDIDALLSFTKKNKCHLVIDEAHAIGVFGKNGEGLVQQHKACKDVFARIVTFGKAMGCHGAAVLGSEKLKEYLVNFSRSFIYTTGLPPHSVGTITAAFKFIVESEGVEARKRLLENVVHFKKKAKDLKIQALFLPSNSAIQCCLIPGNENVKKVAGKIQDKGFNVKAILSPTVPEGEERLRFCLHAQNSKEEIGLVLQILSGCLK